MTLWRSRPSSPEGLIFFFFFLLLAGMACMLCYPVSWLLLSTVFSSLVEKSVLMGVRTYFQVKQMLKSLQFLIDSLSQICSTKGGGTEVRTALNNCPRKMLAGGRRDVKIALSTANSNSASVGWRLQGNKTKNVLTFCPFLVH